MSEFDPARIHRTHNVEAAFGGNLPVVEHCHHCVGINCTGSCVSYGVGGKPTGCVHAFGPSAGPTRSPAMVGTPAARVVDWRNGFPRQLPGKFVTVTVDGRTISGHVESAGRGNGGFPYVEFADGSSVDWRNDDDATLTVEVQP